jgi:hypothetical protein
MNNPQETYTRAEVDALIAEATKPSPPQHWGKTGVAVFITCWVLLAVLAVYALRPLDSAWLGTGLVVFWWWVLVGGIQHVERLWFLLKK